MKTIWLVRGVLVFSLISLSIGLMITCELSNVEGVSFYGTFHFSVPEQTPSSTLTTFSSKEPEQFTSTTSSQLTYSQPTTPTTQTADTQITTQSSTQIDTTPPAIILGFDATALAEGRSNVLTWDVPTDSKVVAFELRYQYDSFSEQPLNNEGWLIDRIRIDENPNNRYVHSGLSNGTTYKYAIFAISNAGIYGIGAEAEATPVDLNPPEEISNLEIDETEPGQLTLTWTNPDDWDFAGVHIRKDTTDYPTDKDAGSAVSSGVGNHCGKTNGCVLWDSETPEMYIDSINNGQTTYYRIYAFDWSCNYSLIGTKISGAAPLNPITELQVFEGDQRLYLSWNNQDSETSEFIIRYNNDPSTEIPTETDGWPVTTQAYSGTPGVIPATNTAIEHYLDSSGTPLSSAPVEYHYTIFAKSTDGIVSSGVSITGSIPAGMTTIWYDDFEGADFCTNWDIVDYDTTSNYRNMWGPWNDSSKAFEGNYFASSQALENTASSDCATSYSAWDTTYRECTNTFMSRSLGDVTTKTKVILTYRYNIYNRRACDGCFDDSCGQTWNYGYTYTSMGGGPPTTSDIFLGTNGLYSENAWSGWQLKIVDLSPYISTDTWIGFRWWARCDGGCGTTNTTSGSYHVDNVRITAY